MGVCFIDPEPEWLEYYKRWSKGLPIAPRPVGSAATSKRSENAPGLAQAVEHPGVAGDHHMWWRAAAALPHFVVRAS